MPSVQIALAVRQERGRVDVEHGDRARALQIAHALQIGHVGDLIANAPLSGTCERTSRGSGLLWEHVRGTEPLRELDGARVHAILFGESPAWDQLPLANRHALTQGKIGQVDDVDNVTLGLFCCRHERSAPPPQTRVLESHPWPPGGRTSGAFAGAAQRVDGRSCPTDASYQLPV